MSAMELRERMRTALSLASAICEAVDKAGRDFTADERQKVAGYVEEAKKAKTELTALQNDAAVRQMIADLGMGLAEPPIKGQPGGPAGRGLTVGQRFTEADAFKRWMAQVAPGGHIPESAKGLHSPPVEFKTLLTGESDTSAGAFVQTDYTGIYEPLGRRLLTVRSLISQRTTGSDLVEFVRQTAQVTQAAPVKESNVTDYAGASGEVSGEKPEGTSTYEKVTAAVKTIAVWIPATKRALSDVGQLRGLIDAELRDDLEEDLEDEIIDGDGSGEHFTGIMHTSGVLVQHWDTDLLTTARKAITTLRVTGRSRATAWLVHPNDSEKIDLLQDENHNFYYGGPATGGVQQLWRVPVVECEAVTEGTGLLGDWRKAVLWDRERATVQISDSHADFFIRNMVAVLAEMRAAFGVIRPHAFVKVDLEAGT